MKLTDIEYNFLSQQRSVFVNKMNDIQKRSDWETVSCKDLRLICANGKHFLSIGSSQVPPYIKPDCNMEAIIDYCSKSQTNETPISLLEKIVSGDTYNEVAKYPITEFGKSDLIERAKVGQRFRDESFLNRNIDTFNDALWTAGLYEEKAKVYKIDNVVFAIPSENYVPLPIADVIDALETTLKSKFENVKFSDGFYCHELAYADFSIEDSNLIKVYQKALNQVFYKPKVIIRLVTSNLGFSGANLYPILEYATSPSSSSTKMMLGEKISLPHKGMASIDEFVKNVKDCFSLIETIPDNLNKLCNIQIQHPVHCLINLAHKCGLPAKYVKPVADQASCLFNGGTATAKQVYMLLSKVIAHCDDTKDKIRLSEKAGKGVRLLLENLEDIDILKIDWITLSKIVADEGQEDYATNGSIVSQVVTPNSMEQISFMESA